MELFPFLKEINVSVAWEKAFPLLDQNDLEAFLLSFKISVPIMDNVKRKATPEQKEQAIISAVKTSTDFIQLCSHLNSLAPSQDTPAVAASISASAQEYNGMIIIESTLRPLPVLLTSKPEDIYEAIKKCVQLERLILFHNARDLKWKYDSPSLKYLFVDSPSVSEHLENIILEDQPYFNLWKNFFDIKISSIPQSVINVGFNNRSPPSNPPSIKQIKSTSMGHIAEYSLPSCSNQLCDFLRAAHVGSTCHVETNSHNLKYLFNVAPIQFDHKTKDLINTLKFIHLDDFPAAPTDMTIEVDCVFKCFCSDWPLIKLTPPTSPFANAGSAVSNSPGLLSLSSILSSSSSNSTSSSSSSSSSLSSSVSSSSSSVPSLPMPLSFPPSISTLELKHCLPALYEFWIQKRLISFPRCMVKQDAKINPFFNQK